MAWRSVFWLAAAMGFSLPVDARTYCCSDETGRRVCGDILPVECQKRPFQEFDGRGVMVRKYDGPMTAEERSRREAERARKKDEERQARELERSNRALRASYASASDIDAKRDRLLTEANESLKQAQDRLDDALAHKQKLDTEAEFFQKKPMPESLKSDIRDTKEELVRLQATVAERKQDITAISARFEDEKKRYLSLGGRR
jgi:chromosome segregation ATPase